MNERALDYFLEHVLSYYLFIDGELYEDVTEADLKGWRQRVLEFVQSEAHNQEFVDYMVTCLDDIWVGEDTKRIYVDPGLKTDIMNLLGAT